MRRDPADLDESGPMLWGASIQFLPQVLPFEIELATGDGEALRSSRATDLCRGEAIAAVRSFFVDDVQIFGDGAERRRMFAEAQQLGMALIALRLSPQYGLGQQGFAPQGDEAAPIEVFGMEAPESHLSGVGDVEGDVQWRCRSLSTRDTARSALRVLILTPLRDGAFLYITQPFLAAPRPSSLTCDGLVFGLELGDEFVKRR
jgi:hypothetical protein